ncbi:MAG: ester cyclase [Myxococcota bacterium]
MSHREWLERFFDRVWHAEDAKTSKSAVYELVSEDCHVHGLPHGKNIGREGFVQFRQLMLEAFDHVRVQVDDVIEDGDRVFMRGTLFFSVGEREGTVLGGCLARIENNQICEAWNQWDFLGLLEQAGTLDADTLAAGLTSLAKAKP